MKRLEDFENIIKILDSFLGGSKNGFNDNGQAQYNCPQCADENGGVPDGKHNLEVNVFIQKFQCWKCGETDGMKGNIGYLIKRYGSKRLYQEYKEEMLSIRKRSLYTFDEWDEAPIENFETFLTLPKTYSKINLKMPLDKRLVAYLKKRKIDQETIDKFSIGYTRWESENPRWSYRIIVPSFDKFGDLNYWVGRDYTGASPQKYCNCDADKKAIVFQDSLINYDAPIYLVEGIFDALRFPNCISLMGKVLVKDSLLYQTLYSQSNSEIVICLDSDTTEFETKKIYKLLDQGKLRGRIRYIRLGEESTPYKDFSEAYEEGGKKTMIDLIKNKKEYSILDLL